MRMLGVIKRTRFVVLIAGCCADRMPVLTVAGDVSSAEYQTLRLVALDLAKMDSTLTVEANPMVEADWAVYLAAKTQELKGSARLSDHNVNQPLAIHSVDGYLGTLPVFLQWASHTYKYTDTRKASEYHTEAKLQFTHYIKTSQNHFCYFDFTFGGKPAPERIIFELFHAKCPKTVENFTKLCTGEVKSKSAASASASASGSATAAAAAPALHYLNSPLHRIVKDGWIQGGDIVDGKGSGGASIYGAPFADETFTAIKHDAAGVLSMANTGPHTNASQWFITLRPVPAFDNKYVGFGRVIAGMNTVRAIAELETKNQRPVLPVVVAACGLFRG